MKLIYLFTWFILISLSTWAADEESVDLTARLYGETSIFTNYWENGASQTDGAVTIQGSSGYQFGKNFKLGIWGSSVHFEGSNASSHIRPLVGYIIPFSRNVFLTIGLSRHYYFNDKVRNGGEDSLNLRIYDYNFTYSKISNLDGSENSAKRYGVLNDINLNTSFLLHWEVNYTAINDDDNNTYFDGKVGLIYPYKQIFYQMFMMANSNPTLFTGRANFSAALGATAKF
jgi:uncharacterized protein (TIGR02001 family)